MLPRFKGQNSPAEIWKSPSCVLGENNNNTVLFPSDGLSGSHHSSARQQRETETLWNVWYSPKIHHPVSWGKATAELEKISGGSCPQFCPLLLPRKTTSAFSVTKWDLCSVTSMQIAVLPKESERAHDFTISVNQLSSISQSSRGDRSFCQCIFA